MAGFRAKLADLETRIQAMAPDPYFKRGELTPIAKEIMREGEELLATRIIAARALARKGITPDRRAMKRTRITLQKLFWERQERGIMTKISKGNAEKRALL